MKNPLALKKTVYSGSFQFLLPFTLKIKNVKEL